MTQEKKQEYTLRITQANKTQMITIIYEMTMDYLNDAIDALAIGKRADADRSIGYAQNCIDELLRSLDMRYELAKNLHKIYIFSKRELMVAGAKGSSHRIWKVIQNFRQLHSAYLELEKADESAKLMGNTQTVVAGLTYGRFCLNEDVTAVSMNRGLMA